MPSTETLPQRESGISSLPQNRPSQPRELVVAQNTSLLKAKRQALSAIVMQDLDDTQLMQIATLLHSLPVSADIEKSSQMVPDEGKTDSHPTRKTRDHVGDEEMVAANNNEVVDCDEKKGDPARKEKDQFGQEKIDAALRKNALYNHTLLHKKIASLPSSEQKDIYHMMSLLLTDVAKFVQKTTSMAQEEVSTSVADILDQHYLLINGIDSLPKTRRTMVYEILASKMTIAQKYVEDKQEHSQKAEKEVEENRQKRTAVVKPSLDEPEMKKLKDGPVSLP